MSCSCRLAGCWLAVLSTEYNKHLTEYRFMLIMKSADWLSLGLYSRMYITKFTGWHWRHFVPKSGVRSLPSLPLPFPLHFFFHPLSFPLPCDTLFYCAWEIFLLTYLLSLYLLSSPFPSFPFPFPFTSPQIQLGGLWSAVNDAYAGWSRHNAAAASHIVTSRQSVI